MFPLPCCGILSVIRIPLLNILSWIENPTMKPHHPTRLPNIVCLHLNQNTKRTANHEYCVLDPGSANSVP